MRGMWLYALPFALAALNPVGADAQGRAQNDDASPYAVLAPDEGYDADSYSGLFKPHGRERSDVPVRASGGLVAATAAVSRKHRARDVQQMHARAWLGLRSARAGDRTTPALRWISRRLPLTIRMRERRDRNVTNEEAATDASVAASQQQFIDGMAAAQQSMNNATFNQP